MISGLTSGKGCCSGHQTVLQGILGVVGWKLIKTSSVFNSKHVSLKTHLSTTINLPETLQVSVGWALGKDTGGRERERWSVQHCLK